MTSAYFRMLLIAPMYLFVLLAIVVSCLSPRVDEQAVNKNPKDNTAIIFFTKWSFLVVFDLLVDKFKFSGNGDVNQGPIFFKF